MLEKNPEEILSLQEKCIALPSHQPALLLPSGSLWSSEAGQKTQEKPSSGKLALKSKVLKGHRQGCHSGWIAWQSHFQAYQIMFHLSEYSCFTSVNQHKLSPQHQNQIHFHSTKGLTVLFSRFSSYSSAHLSPGMDCCSDIQILHFLWHNNFLVMA